jgi:thiol-disulfide isomerase/thioredoxin
MNTAREITRIRYFVLGLAVVLGIALAHGIAGADHHLEDAKQATQPIIAKISADWCGTCTKLKPTIEALRVKYGDRVQVVVLDVTNKDAVAKSTAEAERLGISDFFARNRRSTGSVGIIVDGETLRVLRGEVDVARYDDVIELAIEKSAS